ncbi:FadR/GntR family transcriptional regulator, partial [Peribacillus sp. NPDC060186]
MTISKTNRLSLVEQVVSQIESLIESGEWEIGNKIPPEMDLIKQFDVSRNTLREA